MKIFLATIALILLILLILTTLLGTHTGNVWLWNLACRNIAPLSGELSEGTLLRGFTLRQLEWKDEALSIAVDRAALNWKLIELFNKTLQVNHLAIDELSITLPNKKDQTSQSKEPVTLPDIRLPLSLDIRQLFIKKTSIDNNDINDIRLSVKGSGSSIEIINLSLAYQSNQIDAEGNVTLEKDYPLALKVTLAPDNLLFQGYADIPAINLNLSGALLDYILKVSSHFELMSNPANLSLEAKGNLESLLIEHLKISEHEGFAQLSGQLKWSDALSWDGQIEANNIILQHWHPDLEGNLSGSLTSQFYLSNDSWSLIADDINIKGNTYNYPVHVSGSINVNSRYIWKIEKFLAVVGTNSLSAHGELAEQWNIDAELNAPALKEISPDLQGEVQGSLTLTGTSTSPALTFNLNSDSLQFSTTHIKQLNANGQLEKGKDIAGSASISASSLKLDTLDLKQLKLSAKGKETSHTLSLSTEGTPVSGILSLKGGYTNNQWQGQISHTQLNTTIGKWLLEKPVDLTATKDQLNFSEVCLNSTPSSLCIEPAQLTQQSGKVQFKLSQLNTERFSAFFPKDLNWKARIEAIGNLGWKDKKPDLNLKLTSSPGTLSAYDYQSHYQKLDAMVSLDEHQLKGLLDFQSPKLGDSHIAFTVQKMHQARYLTGQLDIDQLMLDIFAPFIPDTKNLTGTFSAKGRLAGTLEAPLLFGKLSIQGGQLETYSEIANIKDLKTTLTVNGDSGDIDGQMTLGEGVLAIGGQVGWRNLPPTGQITFKGDNLYFQYPGVGEVKVSPKLTLEIGQLFYLKGLINIPWARIEIKSLPENAVAVSDDVIIVKKDATSSLQGQTHSLFKMRLKTVLGNDIKLAAYGLQTDLTGELILQQDPGRPLGAHGTILLKDGRYHYFGQDLLIKEGKIIFQGPIDTPYILVNAIRNPDAIEDDVTAGINLSGPITKPEWSLYSTPEMPQQEQLSYLLRGKGLSGGDSSGLQSMLIGLGVSQFGGVATAIGETLGFSDVSLDTEGSGEDTQITIGGYIAPGLRLQYGAGVFNSLGEVKVRYELMPRLYLQVVSGLAQAVDLFYRFTIKPD